MTPGSEICDRRRRRRKVLCRYEVLLTCLNCIIVSVFNYLFCALTGFFILHQRDIAMTHTLGALPYPNTTLSPQPSQTAQTTRKTPKEHVNINSCTVLSLIEITQTSLILTTKGVKIIGK